MQFETMISPLPQNLAFFLWNLFPNGCMPNAWCPVSASRIKITTPAFWDASCRLYRMHRAFNVWHPLPSETPCEAKRLRNSPCPCAMAMGVEYAGSNALAIRSQGPPSSSLLHLSSIIFVLSPIMAVAPREGHHPTRGPPLLRSTGAVSMH